MNWNNRLRLNMDIISIEKREGIIRGIRMITCKFDDKWKCSFARMDDERKFGRRVFFFFFFQQKFKARVPRVRGTRVLTKALYTEAVHIV